VLFALLVLVDHSFPLGGFNHGSDPMWSWTKGQESFGGLAVAGFFVISGFLVTRSFEGSRSTGQFLWKRFLRIMPGFWVCLAVTVAVFAPLAYVHQYGTLRGYLHGHPDSPLRYLQANWWLSIGQFNIDGLLSSTPYQHSGFPQAFDGSLWTLIYEAKCYLAVAVAGAIGLLVRGRIAILGITLFLWGVQVEQSIHATFLRGVPVIGDPNMVRLAFAFSLGALLYLYRAELPMSDLGAAVAAAVLVISLRTSSYSAVGVAAFAYVCLWAAVRLPFASYEKVGDFSYGIYIYAFPVQQLLALHRAYRFGLVPYMVLSGAGSLACAVPSWFLIERNALRLKRLSLAGLVRRWPAVTVRRRASIRHSDAMAEVDGEAAEAVGP